MSFLRVRLSGSLVTGVACRDTCPVPNLRSASFRGSTASDSTSHHTSVDIVDRAGPPAGLIRQKEHDVVGEILRPAYATDRVECVEPFGQRLLDLIRIDERIEERCQRRTRSGDLFRVLAATGVRPTRRWRGLDSNF